MTPRAFDVASRLAHGETVRHVANDLGVSRAAVYAILRRHRIPLPGYRPKPPNPDAPRPDWSHPSPQLVELAHTIRHEILAAWHPNA